MEWLNASHNQIEVIPGGIIDCQLLERIDFSFNPIRELPIELNSHALMTYISVRNTKISDISCISSIISLEELYANDCCLEEITAAWNLLPNLLVFQVRCETLKFENIHKAVVNFVSAEFVDYSVSSPFFSKAVCTLDCDSYFAAPKIRSPICFPSSVPSGASGKAWGIIV
jgi:hypothetical protein